MSANGIAITVDIDQTAPAAFTHMGMLSGVSVAELLVVYSRVLM